LTSRRTVSFSRRTLSMWAG